MTENKIIFPTGRFILDGPIIVEGCIEIRGTLTQGFWDTFKPKFLSRKKR